MREFEIALDAQHITLLLAERNTEQFMQQFCTMYPNFITRLQEINSNITKNDLVICALIALGEDCASIQKIRHISKESLWAARYRIRTKLKLTHDEKLEDFIRSVIQ